MTRILRTSGLALIAALALALPVGAQADIGGEWTMSVAAPDGITYVLEVSIAQDGADFSGDIESEAGSASFTGGTITGNDIAFVWVIDDEGGDIMRIEVEAEVDGDEMAGTMYLAETGEMPFTGKRESG